MIRRIGLAAVPILFVAAPAHAAWKPRATVAPWQIQLQGKPRLDVRARVFELDGDETSRRVVRRLHRRRRRVICYMNAGAWESFRRDAGDFPRATLGKAYAGYPDERWLDIRRIDLLAAVIRARLDSCREKGFDAVDPDNVNGYSQDTGFPLTAGDQLEFNRWLADEIHARDMAAILKNDGPQARRLARWFDGAVVEECFEFGECGQYRPFTRARKPVYAVEYRRRSRRVCRSAKRRRFSVIFKRKSLRAYRRAC